MKKITILLMCLIIGIVLVTAGATTLSSSIKKNPDDTFTETKTVEVITEYPKLSEIDERIATMEKCKADKEYLESYNAGKDEVLGTAIMNEIRELDSCSYELDYYKNLKTELIAIK